MQRLLSFLGAAIGGWAGWGLGSFAGLFTAFLAGTLGTGIGIYLAGRISRNYL